MAITGSTRHWTLMVALLSTFLLAHLVSTTLPSVHDIRTPATRPPFNQDDDVNSRVSVNWGALVPGVLGIASGLVPVLIVPSAFLNLVSLVFATVSSDPGIPRQFIRDVVQTELLRRQYDKLRGYRNTIDSIIGHSQREPNHPDVRRSLVSFNVALSNDQCLFIPLENIGDHADFFLDFATIHLYTLGVLVMQNDSDHWPTELQQNAEVYVEYAYFLEQLIFAYGDVRVEVSKWIDKWKVLMVPDVRAQFDSRRTDGNYVKYGEQVAFMRDRECRDRDCRERQTWLALIAGRTYVGAYGHARAFCDFGCSETRQAYPQRPNFSDHLVSKIFPTWPPSSDNVVYVRTCASVGIQAVDANNVCPNGTYWMTAHWNMWSRRRGCDTKECPGQTCHLGRWKIIYPGQWTNCDQKLRHGDAVYLNAHDGKGPQKGVSGEGAYQTYRLFRVDGNYRYYQHQRCSKR